MRKALLINIWELSAILLLTSSPLKHCEVGWGQMHIFRFLQKYLIRLKSRLWLGHSNTFPLLSLSHSCCVFRFIVLLEGKPSAQSKVLNALDWIFIKAISIIYWCIELLFHSDESLSPCCWETAPRLLQAHFTFGMELIRWYAELVPFKHDARRPALRRILVVLNFFQQTLHLQTLHVTDTTCFCDPSMKHNFFCTLSQMCGLMQTCFWALQDCSFDPRAWFLLWYALSAVGPFIKTCAFPNHTHSIEFATGYLHSKSSNTYKQYECSWAKFQLSQIRVWVRMQWNH